MADPEKCFQELISEKLLILLRDRPCLVSSNFEALLFLQDKLLESVRKLLIQKKIIKITGPTLSRIISVIILATVVIYYMYYVAFFVSAGSFGRYPTWIVPMERDNLLWTSDTEGRALLTKVCNGIALTYYGGQNDDSGSRKRGVEFKGGSRHQTHHDRQNRHGCLISGSFARGRCRRVGVKFPIFAVDCSRLPLSSRRI